MKDPNRKFKDALPQYVFACWRDADKRLDKMLEEYWQDRLQFEAKDERIMNNNIPPMVD